MYRSNQFIMRWKSLAFALSFVLLLMCAFVACGTNPGASTGSSNATPTAQETATHTAASTTGCPNQTAITTLPPAANVVLTNSDSNKLVSVNKGALIEIDLPAGHRWEAPTGYSPSLLTPQTPTGYAVASSRTCVWRFLAAGTGTVHLTFIGRPVCKPGQACPMYVLAVPFTIDIK